MKEGVEQSLPISVTRGNGGDEYIVNSGVKTGDIIVTEGVSLLREDTPIVAKQSHGDSK